MRNEKLNYHESKKVNTIKELLETAINDANGGIAFEYKDCNTKKNVKVTYPEFKEDIDKLGTALTTIDMADKHIAVIGENSYNWVTVYLTALHSDGVFVPIDRELPYDNVKNLLINSDSEILFFSKKYEKFVENLKKDVPFIKYFVGFDIKETDKLESDKNENTKSENEESEKNEENENEKLKTETQEINETPKKQTQPTNKILSYKSLMEIGKKELEKGNDTFTKIVHKDTNKLKMIVYTSGTTGLAKGVMLSEHNLVSSVCYALEVSKINTKCLSVLPYHHTYEAVPGILVGLYKHATICINDSLKNVLKNMQFYKPDYMFLVPAFAEVFYKNIWSTAKKSGKEFGLKFLIVLSNILRKFGIDKRKKLFKSVHEAFGGNLERIVVGGAPLRPEIAKFFDSIGIKLINGYGITECSPLVSVNMDDFNDPSTVGVVLPCCDVKFENVNEEGDGEICVKGDVVMMGYYKDKERTDKVLKDGWFNTEDYGRFNSKGQLIINGRKKNIIVLNNGKNIYPEEIENYIYKIPYVADAIIKPNKNDSGEEVALCAEVFLNKDKVKELNIDDIEGQLRKDISKVTRDLPSYKHVSKIEIRDKEFEKTTTNKIRR